MSKSGRWYPIRTDNFQDMLTDVLSKFRSELELALQPINDRLDALESQIQAVEGVKGEEGEVTVREAGYAEGFEPVEPMSIQDVYVTTLMARRAIYGYAMLLESMGLSKEQKEAVRQLEAMTTVAIRTIQTLKMLEVAVAAFEAGSGPYGWLMLALAGGTAAASLVYSGRAV